MSFESIHVPEYVGKGGGRPKQWHGRWQRDPQRPLCSHGKKSMNNSPRSNSLSYFLSGEIPIKVWNCCVDNTNIEPRCSSLQFKRSVRNNQKNNSKEFFFFFFAILWIFSKPKVGNGWGTIWTKHLEGSAPQNLFRKVKTFQLIRKVYPNSCHPSPTEWKPPFASVGADCWHSSTNWIKWATNGN